MSKHFCCCIPVRFGVLVISLLGLVFSTFAAFTVWWTLTHQGDAKIITILPSAKPAFIAQGAHFTIVAIASLIGLIGALGRKRGLIGFYSLFLWGSMIATAALGIWAIIKVANTFDDSVATCKADLKNVVNDTLHGNITHTGTTHNDCISAPTAKATFITIFTFALLLQLYGTIIVYRYKHQLDDETRWDQRHDVAAQSTKKSFFSSAPVPEAHPLSDPHGKHGGDGSHTAYHPVATGEHTSYPYNAPQHSHGN